MLTFLKGALMTVEGRTCSITFFVSWFWMHTLILLLFELYKFQHLHFDPIRYQECSLNMWTPLRHYNDERVNSSWMAMFRTRKREHGICCWSKEGPQEIGLVTLPKYLLHFVPGSFVQPSMRCIRTNSASIPLWALAKRAHNGRYPWNFWTWWLSQCRCVCHRIFLVFALPLVPVKRQGSGKELCKFLRTATTVRLSEDVGTRSPQRHHDANMNVTNG